MQRILVCLFFSLLAGIICLSPADAQKRIRPSAAGQGQECGGGVNRPLCASGLECLNTGARQAPPRQEWPLGICCHRWEEPYIAAYSLPTNRPIFQCRPLPCPFAGQVRRGDRCDYPPTTMTQCPKGQHRDPKTLKCVNDVPTCEEQGLVTGKIRKSAKEPVTNFCARSCSGGVGYLCPASDPNLGVHCCFGNQVCQPFWTYGNAPFCQ